MSEQIGIMNYCRQLEQKVNEARKERNDYRLKFIILCTIGKWPIAFWCGVGITMLITLIVIAIWGVVKWI
jgi:hypothetical protein